MKIETVLREHIKLEKEYIDLISERLTLKKHLQDIDNRLEELRVLLDLR